MRCWVSLIGSVLCLIAMTMTPPLIAYLLILFAFGFAADAGLTWMERAGGTRGGLNEYKQ